MNTYFNAVREVSKDSNAPFWSYVLTSQHMNYGSTDKYGISWQYACPTHHIMRMQAYVGLAYGAQGLVFWPFQQPDNQYADKWDGNTMIFLFGPSKPQCDLADSRPETTEAADNRILRDICRLNRELKDWTPFFLGCNTVDVKEVSYYNKKKESPEKNLYKKYAIMKWDGRNGVYVPETAVESGDEVELTDHALLDTPVGCIQRLKVTQEAGVLVSRFLSAQGAYYTMVVNQNPVGAQEVEITHNPCYAGILKDSLLDDGSVVNKIPTHDGDSTDWQPVSRKYTIQPGDCMIFEENCAAPSNDVNI